MSNAILAYSRITGEPLALVQSATEPNVRHVVTMAGQCSCKSFQFRGRCHHTGEPVYDGVKVPLLARLMA